MSLQEKRRANRVPGASNEKPTGSVSRGTYKSSPEGQKRYDATKTDIEAKRLLKKAGASGDVSPTAPKNVRDRVKEIRQKRADKLGTPDPFDSDYNKKTKPVDGRTKIGKIFKSTKPVTTSAPGFGKGDTPGEIRVKGLEKKAFKKTQPKDIKLPKSFTDFQRDLQDYKDRDLPGGPRKTTTTKPKTSDTPLTRQDVGMSPPETPKTKPQKSASAPDFTKKINQANKNRKEFTGDKKSFTKFAKQAETAKNKLRKDVDKIAKNPNLTGKQKSTQTRPVMRNVKIAQDFERGYKSNPTNAVVRTSDLDMIKKTTTPNKPTTKQKEPKNKTIKFRKDRGTYKTAGGFRVTRGVGGGSQQNVTYGANDPDLSRMSAKDRATYQKIKDTTQKGGIPKWMKKFDKKYPIKSFKKAATPAAKAFSKAGPLGKLAAAALVAGGAVYGANQIRKAFAGAGKPKALPTVKGSALRYTSGPKKGQKKYFDLKSFKTNRTFTKSDLKDAGFDDKADQNLQKRIISQNKLIKTANKK